MTALAPPKLGFAFLAYSGLAHPLVWRTFFEGASCHAHWTLAIHASDARPYETQGDANAWARAWLLPEAERVATSWGTYSLVAATNAAAAALLRDPHVAYVVLVSDTSVPIQPFDVVYTHIVRTRGVSSIEGFHPTSTQLSTLHTLGTWPSEPRRSHGWDASNFLMGSQWWILRRDAMERVLSLAPLYEPIFVGCRIPDEAYYMNLLARHDADAWHDARAYEHRNRTYVNWKRSALDPRASRKHPYTWTDMLPLPDIAAAREGGYLFIRKVHAGACVSPAYALGSHTLPAHTLNHIMSDARVVSGSGAAAATPPPPPSLPTDHAAGVEAAARDTAVREVVLVLPYFNPCGYARVATAAALSCARWARAGVRVMFVMAVYVGDARRELLRQRGPTFDALDVELCGTLSSIPGVTLLRVPTASIAFVKEALCNVGWRCHAAAAAAATAAAAGGGGGGDDGGGHLPRVFIFLDADVTLATHDEEAALRRSAGSTEGGGGGVCFHVATQDDVDARVRHARTTAIRSWVARVHAALDSPCRVAQSATDVLARTPALAHLHITSSTAPATAAASPHALTLAAAALHPHAPLRSGGGGGTFVRPAAAHPYTHAWSLDERGAPVKHVASWASVHAATVRSVARAAWDAEVKRTVADAMAAIDAAAGGSGGDVTAPPPSLAAASTTRSARRARVAEMAAAASAEAGPSILSLVLRDCTYALNDRGPHHGYAFALHVDALHAAGGVYDEALCGGGDRMFTRSVLGVPPPRDAPLPLPHPIQEAATPTPTPPLPATFADPRDRAPCAYAQACTRVDQIARACVRGLTSVEGTLLHAFHGDASLRKYITRHEALGNMLHNVVPGAVSRADAMLHVDAAGRVGVGPAPRCCVWQQQPSAAAAASRHLRCGHDGDRQWVLPEWLPATRAANNARMYEYFASRCEDA